MQESVSPSAGGPSAEHRHVCMSCGAGFGCRCAASDNPLGVEPPSPLGYCPVCIWVAILMGYAEEEERPGRSRAAGA